MINNPTFLSLPTPVDLVYVISSLPDRQEWVLLHEGSEWHFPDRGHGKIPGLVDAIRHCFWSGEGRPSLLLIQHGGQQFRLRFHAELPQIPPVDTSESWRDSLTEPRPTLAQLCTMG